jgi:hypothetical protein
MPRLPGRYLTGGCGCGKRLKFRQPPGLDCCGHDSDPRRVRRRERRDLEREIASEFRPVDVEWLASLEPALYDLSDCRHGCNGWPCGSERCTFICHEGLPVKTS